MFRMRMGMKGKLILLSQCDTKPHPVESYNLGHNQIILRSIEKYSSLSEIYITTTRYRYRIILYRIVSL